MLDRQIRKKVEWAFYNYKDLKKASNQNLEDIAESHATVNYGKIASKTFSGNGVENALIKAMDRDYAGQWCNIVECTINHFKDTGKDDFIKYKFFDRLGEFWLCDKLYLERRALFRWAEEILTYAAMVALQENLIKIL